MTKNKKIYLYFFRSRNKDNKDVANFRQRSKTFITTKTALELDREFAAFVNDGQSGEMSRMYVAINTRDNAKIQKALTHKLIDDELDMTKLNRLLASIAAKPENRAKGENKWLFDFDPVEGEDTDELLKAFKKDLPLDANYHDFKTPNGYAVVVDHGFDTRELLAKWPNVELKRDGLLCRQWATKKEDF